MDKIKGFARKIRNILRQENSNQELEGDFKPKTVEYLLRDTFEDFLDKCYKKDIDRYSEVKKLVRDYTVFLSSIVLLQKESVLDYSLERIFPAFLFKLVDPSLQKGLSQDILLLKENVGKIWEAYLTHQEHDLLQPESLGFFSPLISDDKKTSKSTDDILEESEEESEEEKEVQPKKQSKKQST